MSDSIVATLIHTVYVGKIEDANKIEIYHFTNTCYPFKVESERRSGYYMVLTDAMVAYAEIVAEIESYTLQ